MQLRQHPHDTMTPLERSNAIKQGQVFDRLPVSLFATEIKAKMIGCKMNDLYKNPTKMVEAEVYVFNTYGSDGVGTGPNSYGIAEALGAQVTYPEDNIPRISQAVLTDYDQLADLEAVDLVQTDPIRIHLQVVGQLTSLAQGITSVGVSVGGPLTIAAYLRDTTQLMKDFIKKPDQAKVLLDVVVQAQKACVDAFAPYGVSFSLGDPIASPAIISPKQFERFGQPYLAELADYIYDTTKTKPSLHICGKTERIWDQIKDLNISAFSLDNEVDLEEAKVFFGDRMGLVGNIPPVDVLYGGDPATIKEAVKACVNKAYDHAGGYTIAPGCNLPIDTPLDHLDAYMDAVRTYGSYDRLQDLDQELED